MIHLIAAAAVALAAALPTPPVGASAATPSSPAKLLGQRIMVSFSGTSASPALLARIRAGQVGAVILFGANIVSDRQVRALTSSLQRAARAGRNPPLLIRLTRRVARSSDSRAGRRSSHRRRWPPAGTPIPLTARAR